MIEKTCDRVTKRLEEQDIEYKAIKSTSTNSIYIGMNGLGAIRISDHLGDTSAQYNLLSNVYRFRHNRKRKQFMYPISNVDACIEKILKQKEWFELHTTNEEDVEKIQPFDIVKEKYRWIY